MKPIMPALTVSLMILLGAGCFNQSPESAKKELTEKGVPVNATVLIASVKSGDTKMVKTLLNAGVDVNGTDSECSPQASSATSCLTALAWAAQKQNKELVE